MNIADKDVYEYMLNFADDKTIINMLSVNKHFNDEKFFEKVMKRRYPLLIEFRKEKESWKHLFIRMVHILALLYEKYGWDLPRLIAETKPGYGGDVRPRVCSYECVHISESPHSVSCEDCFGTEDHKNWRPTT